ncbi:hypothetical protein BJV82DRAFT_630340 [Fennellomyces sp. T-0311]|nr:hypothetical protein BJV82DRAFT_630340 [Fennellomyces sp. T-0311]
MKMSKRKVAPATQNRTKRQETGANTDPEDPWRTSFTLGRNAFDMANYNAAVDNITLGLSDLLKQQVKLLDVRAAAHGMAARFEAGLHDAQHMIQLAPTLAAGYLRAGELYSMQGHHQRAIDVYLQGFAAVIDNNDKHMLKQHSTLSQTHLNTRVDIIIKAPYEIVSSILEYFDTKQLIDLLGVSKGWRQCLLECSHIWSTTEICERRPVARFKQGDMIRLACASRHIVELTLVGLGEELCEELFGQLMGNTFKSLRVLRLYDCDIGHVGSFLLTIARVADTLKMLDISIYAIDNGCFPSMPVKSMLSACRNLEKFCYVNQFDRNPMTGWIGTNLRTLTSLVLDLWEADESGIADIIRCCPNLRHLSLEGCSNALLQIIRRYRQLQFLSFNLDEDGEPNILFKSQEPGIHQLEICADTADDFMPLLLENAETLQVLNISFVGVPNDWKTPMQPLVNLWSLTIYFGDPEFSHVVSHLLRAAPTLRSLTIDDCTLVNCQDMYATILRLEHLETLEFRQIWNCDKALVMDLLRRLAAKKARVSTLKALRFDCCCFAFDDLMDIIPRILTLRELEILDSERITEQGLNLLFQKLRLHRSIETVRLNDLSRISDTTIEHMRAVKQLNTLRIFGMENVDDLIQADDGTELEDVTVILQR